MATKNSWHDTYMQIAELIGKKHSTCSRIHVGAILVSGDGRIISTGYNGVPSKFNPECHEFIKNYYLNKYGNINEENFLNWITTQEFDTLHQNFSKEYEIHAEMNCIGYAIRSGVGINISNAILYCTYSPCINCAKLIITVGIKKVFYKHKYRENDNGCKLLIENGVECVQI